MAATRGRTVFAIQNNIRLFRSLTSSIGQSMALMRLVSFDAWPLLLVSFLQTARPVLYGLSGSSFYGVTGEPRSFGANRQISPTRLIIV